MFVSPSSDEFFKCAKIRSLCFASCIGSLQCLLSMCCCHWTGGVLPWCVLCRSAFASAALLHICKAIVPSLSRNLLHRFRRYLSAPLSEAWQLWLAPRFSVVLVSAPRCGCAKLHVHPWLVLRLLVASQLWRAISQLSLTRTACQRLLPPIRCH